MPVSIHMYHFTFHNPFSTNHSYPVITKIRQSQTDYRFYFGIGLGFQESQQTKICSTDYIIQITKTRSMSSTFLFSEEQRTCISSSGQCLYQALNTMRITSKLLSPPELLDTPICHLHIQRRKDVRFYFVIE